MNLNQGKIISHYNEAKRILKKMELHFEEDFSKARSLNKKDFSKEFFKKSITDAPYHELYKTMRDYSDYNLFLPSNGSIFQFSSEEKKGSTELRYAYYESPFEQKNYEEFLIELGFSYSDVGDEFIEDYQQYITENNLKDSITNIRYDYSEQQYKELIHPTSHLHIGQKNNIRLPLSYVMLPSNFVAFILKNFYWEKWKFFIDSEKNKEHYLKLCKAKEHTPATYFSYMDQKDLCIYVKDD